MTDDTYKTITAPSESSLTEKRSRFLSFAYPVQSTSDIKSRLDELNRKYCDARHICWAYMLGADRQTYRANDNGEPSSTAGKPILGQINSNQLTDILIAVVRYFGGIELGTSGLTVAYRTAAAQAIAAATITERTVDETITITYEYPQQNDIMRIIKEEQPEIISHEQHLNCTITLRIRKSKAPILRERILRIHSARLV